MSLITLQNQQAELKTAPDCTSLSEISVVSKLIPLKANTCEQGATSIVVVLLFREYVFPLASLTNT
jgi:hypothetical protein